MWERRLDASNGENVRKATKDTIDEVDEKMKRLTNDNFKLTLNSQRDTLNVDNLQTKSSKKPVTTRNKDQPDTIDYSVDAIDAKNSSGINFYAQPDDIESHKRTDTELSDPNNEQAVALD